MMNNSAFTPIEDKKTANKETHLSFLVGYLGNYTALDIERVLGAPLFVDESGDGKVKLEWVVSFECYDDFDELQTGTFSIYDWKNYDRSIEDLYNTDITWHIGGKERGDIVDLFIERFEFEVAG